MSQANYELAAEEFTALLEEDAGNALAYSLLGYCLLKLGFVDEAWRLAREGVRLEPESAHAHFVMSCVLHAQVQGSQIWLAAMLPRSSIETPEVLRAIRETIRLDPENVEYRAKEASIHFTFYDWEQAVASGEAGLKLDAGHLGCATLRALALFHLDRNEEARTAMREVLRLDPENATTQAGQGWLLLLSNRQREARRFFLEALRIDSGSHWAQEGLMECLKSEYTLYRWRYNLISRWSRLKPLARYLILTCVPLAIPGLLILVLPLARHSETLRTCFTILILGGMASLLLFQMLPDIFNLLIGHHPLAGSTRGLAERNRSRQMLGVMAVLFLFVGVALVLKKSQTNILLNVFAAVPVFAMWSQLMAGTAKRLWLVYALIITLAWPLVGTFLWESVGAHSRPIALDAILRWLTTIRLADKLEILLVVVFFCLPVLPIYYFSRSQATVPQA